MYIYIYICICIQVYIYIYIYTYIYIYKGAVSRHKNYMSRLEVRRHEYNYYYYYYYYYQAIINNSVRLLLMIIIMVYYYYKSIRLLYNNYNNNYNNHNYQGLRFGGTNTNLRALLHHPAPNALLRCCRKIIGPSLASRVQGLGFRVQGLGSRVPLLLCSAADKKTTVMRSAAEKLPTLVQDRR